MRHDDRVPPAPEQLLTEGSSLRWPDAVIASGLAIAGGLAVVTALHRAAIPGVLASYMAHAWMAAIALVWFFLFNRKFPIGGLNQGQLRPWYVLSLVVVAANAVETFVSPPGAHLHVPNPPTLVAELVFLAFVVGPTEDPPSASARPRPPRAPGRAGCHGPARLPSVFQSCRRCRG